MPSYRFSKTIFSEPNEKLLKALRMARKRAGLTQVEVAKRLGCRQSFISKIEQGERRMDVVEFVIVAQAYGADPAKLLRHLLPKK